MNDGKGATVLSPRQNTVARLATTGLSNKQIAREIGVSPSTVRAHMHEIFVKLGVGRRSAIRERLAA